MHSKEVKTSVALVVFLLFTGFVDAATFSKSAEFSPIRATTEDILVLVNRIEKFVESANLPNEDSYRYPATLTFTGQGEELELESPVPSENLVGAPRSISGVRYRFSAPSAPISRVEINLADYSREVAVSGASKEQVDALTSLIISDITDLEGGIGGIMHRAFGAMMLLLAGGLVVAFAPVSSFLPLVFKWIFSAIGVFMQLSIWLLPWGEWLPGTLVLPESTSLLERHSPLMSLVGLLIAVFTACVPLYRYLKRSQGTLPSGGQSDGDGA